MKNHRAYTDAAQAEFARAGVTEWRIEQGGKHPRIVYQHGGVERFYVIPATPSDSVRGVLNMASDLRKALGITGPRVKKSTRPPSKRNRTTGVPMPDSFYVAPDPFAVLLGWKPAPPTPRAEWARATNRTWVVVFGER